MDEKQLEAICAYLNDDGNLARSHHVEIAKLDVGPKIKPENIVKSSEGSGQIVVIVDRGIKGSPKYTLEAAEVESFNQVSKSAAPSPVSSKSKSSEGTGKK